MSRRKIGPVKVDGRIIGWWEREPLIFGAQVFHLVANFENYLEELQSEKYGLSGSEFGTVDQDVHVARRVILREFHKWLEVRRQENKNIAPYPKPSPPLK